MSINPRGKSKTWWIDIIGPNGKRIRRSTGTSNKDEAQEYHDRLKSELWRQHHLGEKPRRSWKEAVIRWCKEKSHKKDMSKDLAKLKWLDTHLGDRMLDEIDDDMIDEIIEIKRDEPGRDGEGIKNATIKRMRYACWMSVRISTKNACS
jgi:hypothetical protein